MSSVLVFKCPYCEKEQQPRIDTSQEIATGVLAICDCKESREAWEIQHRADMERKKNAQRGSTLRSKSIVHAGRTPHPTGKYRSR